MTPTELCSRCERPRELFGTPTDTVVEVDRETTERGTVSRTLACLCPWCGWDAVPKPWYWVRDTEAAERAIVESFGGDPERGPIMTDGGEDVDELQPKDVMNFDVLQEERLDDLVRGIAELYVDAVNDGEDPAEAAGAVIAAGDALREYADVPATQMLGALGRNNGFDVELSERDQPETVTDGGVMLGTPPESSSSADSPRARYKATYRHGNGYDVVYLTDHRSLEGGRIVAEDVDGKTHQWTPGADVHIVEVDR